MPIDLLRGKQITLSAARRKHLPQFSGQPISPATANRWVHRGVLAGDGTYVRLPAARCGRELITTEEACAFFLSELARRAASPATAVQHTDNDTEARLMAEGLLPVGRKPASSEASGDY